MLNAYYSAFRHNLPVTISGSHIEFLLTNHIKSLIKEQSKIKKILTSHKTLMGFLVGILVFAVSLLGSILASIKFTDSATTTVLKELSNSSNLNQKVEFIANYIANGTWFKFTSYNNLFIIIMVGISVFLGIWVGTSLDIDEPSFILLTEEAKKDKIKVEKKHKMEWLKFVLSVVISSLSGIASSFIFNLISKGNL